MSQYDPVVPSDPYSIPDPDGGIDFLDLQHVLAVGVMWLIAAIGVVTLTLIVWRLRSPATFRRYVATPGRRARWVLWALISWPRVAKACGLSASERVTRTDSQGKARTRTVWTHPRLLGVGISGECLRITVRTRTGQTVDDLENAVPAIRDAVGAHSARSTVDSPGTVCMEFVMRQQLSAVELATQPTRPKRRPSRSADARTGRPGRSPSLASTLSLLGAQGLARARFSGVLQAD